jgi:YesN/AraC family two-component response regulator
MPPKVLIVDDERGITETLATILKLNHYATEAAFDGIEGYELACRARPDLIISDVAMPKMDGIEMVWSRHGHRTVAGCPKARVQL